MGNSPLGTKMVMVAFVVCLLVMQVAAIAQNLGSTPQFNVAVLGQTGAQPEGTILNIVNWVANVIMPVGAGLAIAGAVFSFASGRGVYRWLLTAAGMLAVSGLTRLVEFFITNGTGGVS